MKQYTIGRSSDNDFTIDDASVSRYHAKIIQTASGIVICDNGSSNGTFINGNRINQESPLKKNDILKLGTALVPWMNYVGFQQESNSHETKLIQEEIQTTKPSPNIESSNIQNQNVQQNVIIQQSINTSSGNSNGMGTAGFVIGLLSFITSFIGIGGLLGIFGLIFSFAGLFKNPRGLAITGLILSILGIAIAIEVVN